MDFSFAVDAFVGEAFFCAFIVLFWVFFAFAFFFAFFALLPLACAFCAAFFALAAAFFCFFFALSTAFLSSLGGLVAAFLAFAFATNLVSCAATLPGSFLACFFDTAPDFSSFLRFTFPFF